MVRSLLSYMSSPEEKSVVLRATQEFLSGRRLSITVMEAFGCEDKALGLELDHETENCAVEVYKNVGVGRAEEKEGRRGMT